VKADDSPVTRYFVQALKKIVKLPGYEYLTSWQRWEYFGALYHTVRVNAFLITGTDKVSLHRFLSVHHGRGSGHSACPAIDVILRPAMMIVADEPLSTDTDLSRIQERRNALLIGDVFDDSLCFVFCHSTGGHGVDVFFSLSLQGGGHLLLLDQRRRDNLLITNESLEDLTAKMKAVVPVTDSMCVPMSLICSPFSTFEKRRLHFPPNSVAMTRRMLEQYHGPFASVASTFTKTDPNSADNSTLNALLGCSEDLVAAVNARAKERSFATFRDLQEFLRDQGAGITLANDVRACLLLIDDEDDNGGDGGDGGDDDDYSSDVGQSRCGDYRGDDGEEKKRGEKESKEL
jgi:hypothetical protein